MIVNRLSHLTGKINQMDIPITPQQLVLLENRERAIQDIVPHLSAEHREFLMTGMTPEEWNEAFPPDEE
jgi:hypothetical protein